MPNLLLAAHNAGQGKRQRDEVVEFEKIWLRTCKYCRRS